MASRRTPNQEMEESFARMRIEDEEEGGLMYEGSDVDLSEIDVRRCLVGRFLTESPIDFQAMQHKMASLWRPGRGVYVKELEPNRFIFQFYHEVDIKRVIEGSPWTFGRFHLVFERLKAGDNPRTIRLNNIFLWVQLHGMDHGFMSQRVVKDIGNYIGTFIESDANNFMEVWRDYLRVRVSIPLDVPLKRRMKLKKSEEKWCWANFKYEGVPTFCFICGMIGHSEKFCERIFETPLELIEKPYGIWMRAEPKRRQHTIGSKWLKQGGSIPVASTAAESAGGGNRVNSIIVAGEGSNNGKSGIATSRIDDDQRDVTDSNSQGIIRAKNLGSGLLNDKGILNEGREYDKSNLEDNGLVVVDPKRRRTEHEDGKSPSDEIMLDTHVITKVDQKNLQMAGSGSEARRSL